MRLARTELLGVLDIGFGGFDLPRTLAVSNCAGKVDPKTFLLRGQAAEAQDEEQDKGFGDAPSIDALIKSLGGMDVVAIKANIGTNKAKYDAAIQADQKEGAGFGIQGTPGFIIGKQSIDGAVPLAQFQAAIDSQLK